MKVVPDTTLYLKEASVVLTKLTETTLPEGLTCNVPGLDSPNKGPVKEMINSSNGRCCVESVVTRCPATSAEQNTKLTSLYQSSTIPFSATSKQTSATTIKPQVVSVGVSLNEGDFPLRFSSSNQNESDNIRGMTDKHSEQIKNKLLCESSKTHLKSPRSKKVYVSPGDRLEKIAAKLISRRESMQDHNLNDMQGKSMTEKGIEIKHKNILNNLRKKDNPGDASKPLYTCTLSKQTKSKDLLNVDGCAASDIRVDISPPRPKLSRKARTIPNILSRSVKQKSLSAPPALHKKTVKILCSEDIAAKGIKTKFQTYPSYEVKIKQEPPDIDTSRNLRISTKSETLGPTTPNTTWFAGGVSITNPKSFPYIKLLGNHASKTPVVDVSRIKKEKFESDLDVDMATAKKDHDSSVIYKSSKGKLQEDITKHYQNMISPFTSLHSRHQIMDFRKSKIAKVDDLANSSTNVHFREIKCTESSSLPVKSTEKPFFSKNSTKNDMNWTETGIITYADYCAQMDADAGVEIPTIPKCSKKNLQEKKMSAITYADYCAQMDAAETGARAIKSEKVALDENPSTVIFASEENNPPKKRTGFSTESSLATDSSSVISVPQLTNGSINSTIKQELEEDIDGNHLFDHGYTKTPDSSPSKKDVTKTSPQLYQNLSRPGRVKNIASNNQSPVYAVKYGNKLFLIPSNNVNVKAKLFAGPIAPHGKLEQRQVQRFMVKLPNNVKHPRQIHKKSKRISKKKMEFTRKLSLAQRRIKMSKKTSRISFKPKHGGKHHPVQRYAKVIHVTPSASGFTGIIKRVSITLTKGTDIELKRWHSFTDFQVRLTYDNDKCTIKHMEADSLKTGFYKIYETYELSNQTNRKTMAVLSCMPPHQDILAEGEQFIAVGPLFNVLDGEITNDTTKIYSRGQLQAYLSTILPASTLCILNSCISDTSYRPKIDDKLWYSSPYFDYFTRKICPNRRQTERKSWDHIHTSY